jgi:hypothetical protein
MPKSTFLSKVSALNAAISPKSGSSGACGTASALKLVPVVCDIWPVIACNRDREAECAEVEEDGEAFRDGMLTRVSPTGKRDKISRQNASRLQGR